jgi:hypothetical protein
MEVMKMAISSILKNKHIIRGGRAEEVKMGVTADGRRDGTRKG